MTGSWPCLGHHWQQSAICWTLSKPKSFVFIRTAYISWTRWKENIWQDPLADLISEYLLLKNVTGAPEQWETMTKMQLLRFIFTVTHPDPHPNLVPQVHCWLHTMLENELSHCDSWGRKQKKIAIPRGPYINNLGGGGKLSTLRYATDGYSTLVEVVPIN